MVQLQIVQYLLSLRFARIALVLAKIPPKVIGLGRRHERRRVVAGACRVVYALKPPGNSFSSCLLRDLYLLFNMSSET